jgi:hypothetical protein
MRRKKAFWGNDAWRYEGKFTGKKKRDEGKAFEQGGTEGIDDEKTFGNGVGRAEEKYRKRETSKWFTE